VKSESLIQRLHQHRLWVNQKLLAAAGELSDEQLRQSFPIGQGSIWQSLVHMLAAEYVWLEALMGDENPLLPGDLRGRMPGNQLAEGGINSLDMLRRQWDTLAQRWERFLETPKVAALDDIVYKRSSFNPEQRFGTRRADILLHVCTHSQYTTAQVINMLRQVGVEKLPDVMLISMARQETTAGT
jgi:uncharacterized damage-inducible protein DinB